MQECLWRKVFRDLTNVLLTVIALLALWEVMARLRIYDVSFFPPPSAVANTFFSSVESGELISDTWVSIKRALVGFLAGSCIGAGAGILTGRLRILDLTIGQVIRLLRSIPSIALVPLAIVWFGLGETSKYLLVFWGVFFPVWVNSHIGAAQVDQTFIWAARSLGASTGRLLYEVILPAATPHVIAGMRTGIATAFVVLMAAEMAGAFGGLGYRIYVSHLVFRVDKMVVAIVVLGVIGAVTDVIFAAIVSLIPWSSESAKRTSW